jgi:hypothetical protein
MCLKSFPNKETLSLGMLNKENAYKIVKIRRQCLELIVLVDFKAIYPGYPRVFSRVSLGWRIS